MASKDDDDQKQQESTDDESDGEEKREAPISKYLKDMFEGLIEPVLFLKYWQEVCIKWHMV